MNQNTSAVVRKHTRSQSDCTGINSSISRILNDYPGDGTNQSSIEEPQKSCRRPRFLEDGGSSIVIATGGHDYPKRQRGQSLVDYLMSNQSSKSCPELDRENAHFSVSEAMIAAIEESRFLEWRGRKDEEEDEYFIHCDPNDESDEEVRQLKLEVFMFGATLAVSNQVVDTSVSPVSSMCTATPPISPTYSTTTLNPIDIKKPTKHFENHDSGVSFTSLHMDMEKERQKSRKLVRLKRVRSRLNLRPFSPSSRESTPTSTTPSSSAPISGNRDSSIRYALSSPSSPVPILSPNATPPPALNPVQSTSQLSFTSEPIVSAESIALNLLSHFSKFQPPKESAMEWLVSEKDAPQHLLPLPQSWPVNPDEPFMQLKENEIDDVQIAALRGNSEWAPPRPQIVFAVYSSPNLKVVMAKQNYRCAGCGMKVEPEYCHSFRYCHYLGRYFCTACHTNKSFIIPSRILKKWDFKKYYISNFSFDLLQRMWYDPLFRLGYINPLLYRRCKQLNKVLELRLQLVHVAEFLRICRYAATVWEDFRKLSEDWLDDPEIYSLYDLTRVNSGELSQLLRLIVTRGMEHIVHCELCQARGFLCEKCHASQVIFPFQIDAVVRCEKCGSCYHRSCWDPTFCMRCQRISRRLQDKGS